MNKAMDIRVDGYQFTGNGPIAHSALIGDLPAISADEKHCADRLGVSECYYRLFKLAGDLGTSELEKRARSVGEYVERGCREREFSATVSFVWLSTDKGKFRVKVETPQGSRLLFFDEDLIDDFFGHASPRSLRAVESVLTTSFGVNSLLRN
jgi:hypothetical protein